MTSEKQLEANRENAKLGGVKTDQGKAVSKLNSLKHGILTKDIILSGENENELVDFGRKIRMELKPSNEIEMLLAERIIANTWRLKRALKAETQMIEYDMQNEKNFGIVLSYDLANHDSYGKFTRYETCLERGIYKALHELQRIQATRMGEKSPLPVAIDVNVTRE
jgi:hypothetical protein